MKENIVFVNSFSYYDYIIDYCSGNSFEQSVYVFEDSFTLLFPP